MPSRVKSVGLPSLAIGLVLALGSACSPGEKLQRIGLGTSSADSESGEAKSAFATEEDLLPAISDRTSCGSKPAFGIVNGTISQSESQVSAATVRLSISGIKFCTGTLVGPNQIVTAAHCLNNLTKPNDIRIGLGNEGEFDESLVVESFAVHPQFRGVLANESGLLYQSFHDVAAIKFRGTLPSDAKHVGFALPGELKNGLTAIVAGFGAYGTDDKGRRPLTEALTSIEKVIGDIKEIQLSSKDGKGACYGDSGGPTFIVDPSSSCLLLVGSTTGPSRSNFDGQCERGGGTLMDLTRYQSWLACAFINLKAPLTDLPKSIVDKLSCN